MSYVEKLDVSKQIPELVKQAKSATFNGLGNLFNRRTEALSEHLGAFVMHEHIYNMLKKLNYKQDDIDMILDPSLSEIKQHLESIGFLTDAIISRLHELQNERE